MKVVVGSVLYFERGSFESYETKREYTHGSMVSNWGWLVQARKAWQCLRLGGKLSYCNQLLIFWDKYFSYVVFSLHYFISYMCNDGWLVVWVFMYWMSISSWRKDESHIVWNLVSILVTFFLFFFFITKNCNFGSILLRGVQPYDKVWPYMLIYVLWDLFHCVWRSVSSEQRLSFHWKCFLDDQDMFVLVR